MEQGTFAVLNHTYQSGADGTVFDYREMGGQEILYPFQRYVVGGTILDKHRVSLLYQPLKLVTNVRFKSEVEIDNVTFEAGTPMEITYGFPFYRLTYTYDLIDEPGIDVGVGGALQLRNASLIFKALDADDTAALDDLTVSQNLGPVPAISVYARYAFDWGLQLTAEATGLYASSKFINGADFDFTGSILDASLRMGYELKHNMELFGNLRFLGGTAEGESEYVDRFWTESDSAYTANKLATMSATIGIVLR